MKTLALAMILLPAIALADYDDGYGNDDNLPIHRYPTVEDPLNRPREYVLPPTPVMPSMITLPKDRGSTYFGPDQWCRSDGDNTFCFKR